MIETMKIWVIEHDTMDCYEKGENGKCKHFGTDKCEESRCTGEPSISE